VERQNRWGCNKVAVFEPLDRFSVLPERVYPTSALAVFWCFPLSTTSERGRRMEKAKGRI
jgi:hypothetical protein